MNDQLLIPDFEKILEAFCDPDGVQEFFNIRNAVRQAMRDREALLAFKRRMTDAISGGGECVYEDDCPYCAFDGALAALPEHLKE